MKKTIRLALGQINPTVGDLDGNSKKMIEYIAKAKSLGSDILSFPELAITGYPPEDLLLKSKFIDDNLECLTRIAKTVGDMLVVTGFVDRKEGELYNAAAIIYKGEIKGTYYKIMLPNYGVFDEKRYFRPGTSPTLFRFGDILIGVNICEDIWHNDGPVCMQASSGASLILNINDSPYYAGRSKEREEVVKNQARNGQVIISYINLVGGQDELVFDGQSMIIDSNGRILCRAKAFNEDLLLADIDIPTDRKAVLTKKVVVISDTIAPKNRPPIDRPDTEPMDPTAEIYQALVLGLKDYVGKNGFNKAVLGLSGGIDSSLVATMAVDALGKDNVIGAFMPTHYSSPESEKDAKELASNLGIKFMTISIEQIFKIYLLSLEPHFAGLTKNIAEENLQARIRGNILMALSNKFGWLVLTTGNKSEMSTGYATLYGDMAGGFAIIKDVPKTLVYKLAEYRNSITSVIPESSITKEPTAELKPNQKDSDTLPPYSLLDQILKAYIEEDKGLTDIISMGFEKETVSNVVAMVDKSEYKRRQSPPGVKITPKALGKDRRMPITNKYK